jgi:hypothetical protein
VDAVEKPVRACSGCAGDYEDPDRMAWEEETEEEEEEEDEEGGRSNEREKCSGESVDTTGDCAIGDADGGSV